MSQFFMASATLSSLLVPVVSPVSYPYNILPTDYAVIVDTSQARTLNLPTPPVKGMMFLIKDGSGGSGANAITVNGNGSTIDDQPDYTVQLSYGFVGVLYNGVQWSVVNQ